MRERGGGEPAGESSNDDRLSQLERRVRNQANRVKALEEQLQEERALHRRVAELTDVMTELVLPATARDDDRLRAALAELADPSPGRGPEPGGA